MLPVQTLQAHFNHQKLGEFIKTGNCIPAAPVQPTYFEMAKEILKCNAVENNTMDMQQAFEIARQQIAMPPAMA